jgi:hypothetical protein
MNASLAHSKPVAQADFGIFPERAGYWVLLDAHPVARGTLWLAFDHPFCDQCARFIDSYGAHQKDYASIPWSFVEIIMKKLKCKEKKRKIMGRKFASYWMLWLKTTLCVLAGYGIELTCRPMDHWVLLAKAARRKWPESPASAVPDCGTVPVKAAERENIPILKLETSWGLD